MQIISSEMFKGHYFSILKQCLFSKGHKAAGKQVLPFYLIIAISAFIYLFMEKSSLDIIFLVVLFLLALPFLALSLGLLALFLRAKSSSKKLISVKNNKVVIQTKSGEIKYYENLYIKYFDGCFIDFMNKNNLFDSHALFGDEQFLIKVIEELKKNGFEVFKVSEEKINW